MAEKKIRPVATTDEPGQERQGAPAEQGSEVESVHAGIMTEATGFVWETFLCPRFEHRAQAHGKVFSISPVS